MTTINTIISHISDKFIPFYLNEALYFNEHKIKLLLLNFDDTYLENIIIKINQIISPIISLYNELDEETKKNNLSLNIYICILLNKYLFFIYATYTIFNDIKLKNQCLIQKKSSKKQKIDISLYETSFREYIRNIIKKFNYDILNINISNNEKSYFFNLDEFNNKYIIKIKLDESYIVPSDIKSILISKENIIKYIKYFIYMINNVIYIKPNIKNYYITIPQYENICWFISILTAITYSDMSKKLLLSNGSSRINYNYQEFNNFIFYIIDNITATHKIYNENIIDDCEIFKELKKKPLYIIKYLFVNYIKINIDKILNIIIDIITKVINNISFDDIKVLFNEYRNDFIKNNDNYFINLFIFSINIEYFYSLANIKNKDDLLSKNKELIDFIKENISIINIDNSNIYRFEIFSNEKLIFSILYDILNINNMYCKCYKKDSKLIGIRTSGNGIMDISPDIIIMDFNTDTSIIYDGTNNFDININPENYELNYNNTKYKLDYVINSTIDDMSCENCGHCICAIHYDKKQFFYNSTYDLFKIKCNDDKINIPCSLIKQNWTKNIYDDICYSLEKCEYYEKQNKELILKETKIDNYNNICFNLNMNITYVYVKIPKKVEIIDNSDLEGFKELSSLDEFYGGNKKRTNIK